MNFKFHSNLAVMLISITSIMQSLSNFFLSAPSPISLQELAEQIKSKSFSMTWCHPHGAEKGIEYHAGKLAFRVSYTQLPTSLTEVEKSLFATSDQQLYYQYKEDGYVDRSQVVEPSEGISTTHDYYVEKPRVIKNTTQPNVFSCNELAQIIATKRVIFYTGAGISIAADVWDMATLMRELGLSESELVDDFVQNVINSPYTVIEKAHIFFHDMLHQEPTMAHYALSLIAQHFQCQIITENLDCLHERTGIRALRVQVADFIQRTADIKDVEIVICCGLSHDDRGFLAWYKKHNPQGIIIALDIKKPRYIDQEDGILFGDIQEVLPQLVQLLEKREKNNGNTKK